MFIHLLHLAVCSHEPVFIILWSDHRAHDHLIMSTAGEHVGPIPVPSGLVN